MNEIDFPRGSAEWLEEIKAVVRGERPECQDNDKLRDLIRDLVSELLWVRHERDLARKAARLGAEE